MAFAIRSKSAGAVSTAVIEPMLATLGKMPSDPTRYAFEIKWDGIRAVIEAGNGKLVIRSRNGIDITSRYPELAGLANSFGKHRVVLDGEIISLGPDGRPSFPRLTHRIHLTDPADIRRMAAAQPIFLVLFDLLRVDRRSMLDVPYTERRAELESLGLSSEHWQVTPVRFGDGQPMLQLATERRLEGLVAKRLDSVYMPGRRSPDWLKIKLVNRQEFVIGGWVPEKSGDATRIGALLIGVYGDDGQLHYVGKVGTGLSAKDHAPLLAKLTKSIATKSPFVEVLPKALYVRPSLVAEVEYRRWPKDALVHQSSFKGLRTDKKPTEVKRETAPTD